MNRKSIFLLLFLLAPISAFSLEVDREVLPRLSLGGRFLSTVDWSDQVSDPTLREQININDSSLLLALDKRTYGDEGVAGAVIGIRDSDTGVFMQQLHGHYWKQNRRWLIGRTRLHNTLVEFPVLRDDDLMEFTHVLNGESNEEHAQIYGEILSFDWYIKGRTQRLNFWTGSRESTIDGFNSYGVGFVSQQPEDLVFSKSNPLWGLRIERQEVDGAAGREWMTAWLLGGMHNINKDPSGIWSLSLQFLGNLGVDNSSSLVSLQDRAHAKSLAVVTGLRYTHRPKLLTRHQLGLTMAYKDFSEVNHGNQWSIIPSYICRFGQGIDMVAQVKYTEYGQALWNGSDISLQIGLSFSFDAVFNDQIGQRDSILNLEHGYLP